MRYLSDPIIRRRLAILAGLVFALWASWKVGDDSNQTGDNIVPPTNFQQRVQQKPPPSVSATELAWPARQGQAQPVSDLFSVPPPPAVYSRPDLPPEPVVAIPLPVLAVKYVGRLVTLKGTHVFLANANANDQVMTVGVGQTVQEGWKLESMDTHQLLFRHTASGQEQTMPIGAAQ